MEEYVRDPCPYRIVDDCGGAFALGAVGGSVFHSIQGFRNAAKGTKLRGALTKVVTNSPRTAGSFSMWGLMFTTADCSFAHIRGKEDPWNSIMSGFTTGFILALPNGYAAATGSGIVGGILLGMIEGISLMMNRWAGEEAYRENDTNRRLFEDPTAEPPQPEAPSISSVFGMFGPQTQTSQ
ncbi:mitochondrial import inner membrane translocase subunit Tim17-A-like [Saccostrea echinata]|uniref:mitochondrial import inner membrane translocase subunit Tim17-A-like n=1 Tax=Saccostrea echinata TaxID=191078 RepID=UPI002A8052E8|nr:mitochondrial import inner membrane translocase subunit Tim17-A-like [Saccostrea echinata]